MADKIVSALFSSRERPATTSSGYAMLIILVLVIAMQIFGIVGLATGSPGLVSFLAVIVGPILLVLLLPGFYMLQQIGRASCRERV